MLDSCFGLFCGTLPVFLQAVTGKVIKQLLVFLIALRAQREIPLRISAQISTPGVLKLLHFFCLLLRFRLHLGLIIVTHLVVADPCTAFFFRRQDLLKLFFILCAFFQIPLFSRNNFIELE